MGWMARWRSCAESEDANPAASPRRPSIITRGEGGSGRVADVAIVLREEPARSGKSWMYHVPRERLVEYARLRVESMVLRDQRGAQITENDWARISVLLEQSWTALQNTVRSDPDHRDGRTTGSGVTSLRRSGCQRDDRPLRGFESIAPPSIARRDRGEGRTRAPYLCPGVSRRERSWFGLRGPESRRPAVA